MQLPLNFPASRKETALGFVLCRPKLFRDGFASWIDANFHVWSQFEAEAYRVWLTGRKRYSAHTVIEYLRHYTLVADKDAEFKLNEKWSSSIARLYAVMHPAQRDFFEFRERRHSVVERPSRQGVMA